MSPQDVATYIGEMAAELAKLAKAAGLAELQLMCSEIAAEAALALDAGDRGRACAQQLGVGH